MAVFVTLLATNVNSKAEPFLRRGRRTEGEQNCFWCALNSTNQLESPRFRIFFLKICSKRQEKEMSTSG